MSQSIPLSVIYGLWHYYNSISMIRNDWLHFVAADAAAVAADYDDEDAREKHFTVEQLSTLLVLLLLLLPLNKRFPQCYIN